MGDYKSIHSRIFEFRIHYGPGYRIYFTIKKQRIILLLVGGVKESQKNDIEKAKRVLEEVEKNNE
ncbi:MAG: type II toxin-antitoxin system RelE/ParE family toxin [Melioribacteraceae bacterium]|nr:type II toxin-antitoxin system RelE/ParE family toxin [Melioribacteraceae bacterium]